jgi:hypothetical protein
VSALDAAQQRAAYVEAELRAPRPDPVSERAEPPVDDITPHLSVLCDAIDEFEPVEHPEALALADAFDELDAEPVAREPAEDVDLGELTARVATARLSAAQIGGLVRPDARAQIEACHRAVVEAETSLFESRRKERSAALGRYQQAIAAERAALTRAGVDSYAAFLVAIAQGHGRVDLAALLRAELEVADAEAALRQARAQASAPAAADIDERRVVLRARAAQLLRRFPGDDPAADLRALRIPHPDRAVPCKELRELLSELGEHPSDEALVATARAAAAQRVADAEAAAAVPPAPPEPEVDRDALTEEKRSLDDEIRGLVRDCAEHEQALTVLDHDRAYIDEISTQDLATMDLANVDALFGALFGSYRTGDLLAGRLPLVLDGALDGLEPARVDAVVDRIAAATDIQVIVVTADPHVDGALNAAHAHRVAWLPAPAAAPVASCTVHADKDSAASCSQCGRASCAECLVYVPGDELACRTCAEAMHGRTLRVMRRRGA